MERVASFQNFQNLIDFGSRLQADVAQQSVRMATGKVSDDYSDISATTRLVLDLERDLALSSQYADNAALVQPYVDSMYSSLSTMTDTLSSFRATLASGMGGDINEISNIASAAQSALDEMTTLLNTEVAGVYIFGGSVTDRPPVDMTAYTTATYPSTASTDYYQGNDHINSFIADTDYEISYGITADDDAFEQAIRAMNMVANMTTYDSDALQEAYGLISNAIDGTAELLARTSIKASAIEDVVDVHTEYELFAETLISDLTDADAAEATAEMQALQTQLEASYTALSKSLNMSIMDYL